jgi:hypothetical protein
MTNFEVAGITADPIDESVIAGDVSAPPSVEGLL